MSYLESRWIDFGLSFRFPKYYFYLHDNCSYCSRHKPKVPFLSAITWRYYEEA